MVPQISKPRLGTIITAMVTPFDADLKVSESGARRVARHLVDHGSDGLVVAGTTGESATLDDREKLTVLEAVIDEVGDRAAVIAGTGSNDTAHSVHLTEATTERGADGILVVTPYYNKPSRRGLKGHFEAVAGATDLPVVLYNIPARCVINLDPDLLVELSEIPNVAAIKQANDDLEQARRIVDETTLALYAGDDALLRPFAELGGAGGICVSSHVAGEQMRHVYEAARAGDSERAAQLDAELADLYETMFFTASPGPVKAALNLIGLDVGGLRLPMVELDEPELERVRATLDRMGLGLQAAKAQ
jgi:4-hydroxy-tetrahydrodipicolinate synthase